VFAPSVLGWMGRRIYQDVPPIPEVAVYPGLTAAEYLRFLRHLYGSGAVPSRPGSPNSSISSAWRPPRRLRGHVLRWPELPGFRGLVRTFGDHAADRPCLSS